MDSLDISHSQEIFTVSRLNRDVRFLLEDSFPLLWIEGEISNFSVPQSGHWYFSLKDSVAQVRCAMFRPQNRKLNFIPKDGSHVLIKARVSLYEGRGEFQLLIEHLEEAGEGRLQQEFEKLKKRLFDAGLFDPAHKKKLPLMPQTIGVITSPTGAAIRDILSVLKRRFSCANIIIYPTLVQGELAANNIVEAIQIAAMRKECDVLILSRGGGSLEDLWPFNEEKVAHAIFNCPIPLISGVGHEVDFTIADFVADQRAATPSAAAELVVPHCEELLEALQQSKFAFLRLIKQPLQHFQKTLEWMQTHLMQQHPKRKLTERTQRLDLCEMTLTRLMTARIQHNKLQLQALQARLLQTAPQYTIQDIRHTLQDQLTNLHFHLHHLLRLRQEKLSVLAGKLDGLSPLLTLQRGFAIVTDQKKRVLVDACQVGVGEKVEVQLMKGKLVCEVEGRVVE